MYCVSLSGYTWECGLKHTGTNIQTLQDEDTVLLLEKNIVGGIGSVMGDRYVESYENKEIIYADANTLYGVCMSQALLYDEIEKWHGRPDLYMNKLQETINTADDSKVGYFVEVDLRYPNIVKEKTKNFPICPENIIVHKDKDNEKLKKIKPKSFTKAKKLMCDWTDKKN